ncbi:ParB/RepB/Spo0J family partition protein [Streptomyces sp. 184]|uniref:ParB/RepB/Spo0J family partition protein n=1 Tax=Streptomyces sp. 184 TaxID=1827526 RepID=UPI003892B10D
MAVHDVQTAVIADGFSSAAPDDEPAAGDAWDPGRFEQLPARDIPVHALSPGLRLRQAGTDAAHVQLLAEATGRAGLPPLLVQQDGCRVIDGLHRLEAARLRGDASVRVRFLDCTDSEALVLAMKANSAHGLPLSKADRLGGARRVLAAHPDWSDRAIAGISGLSAKTIAALRLRTAGAAAPGGKRLGRDGRKRPVNAGEGRRRAAEYISAHPDAPLRQVARETDVSLGTVHDVKARLRRGVSPERNGRRGPAPRPAVHAAAAPAPGSGVSKVLPAAEAVTALPAPAPAAVPRRRNYTDPPPTWAAVAEKVATDPTVRYTESGKEFLQWMAAHAADPDGWHDLVNAVPTHWLSVIAPIADGISKEWSLFAERLRSRQQAV